MKARLFFTAVFLAPVVALSQSTEPMKTKALSFGFNGSGNLGGKIWISDQHALTVSVDGSVASTTREAIDTTRIDDEYSSSSTYLAVGLQRHIDMGWDASPFLTGVLSVGTNRNENRYGSTASPRESTSKSVSLGAHVGVGVEFWMTPRISLSGQQLISGSYHFGKYSSGLVGEPSEDSRSFDLGLGTSALTLSVYL